MCFRYFVLIVPSAQLEAPLVKSIGYNAVVLTWLSAFDISISGYKVSYQDMVDILFNRCTDKERALFFRGSY